MEIVVVGSKNPIKIEAVKKGFEKMFPNRQFDFKGLAVPSDVSDQPLSNDETLSGAKNRANKVSKKIKNASYFVGIEGGIEKSDNGMEVFAWIVIKSYTMTGKARTGSFFLPHKIAELVDQGFELGEADDIVFDRSNSKQNSGAVGLLTENVIDRTHYYVPAVVLALIPFKNPDLYQS